MVFGEPCTHVPMQSVGLGLQLKSWNWERFVVITPLSSNYITHVHTYCLELYSFVARSEGSGIRLMGRCTIKGSDCTCSSGTEHQQILHSNTNTYFYTYTQLYVCMYIHIQRKLIILKLRHLILEDAMRGYGFHFNPWNTGSMMSYILSFLIWPPTARDQESCKTEEGCERTASTATRWWRQDTVLKQVKSGRHGTRQRSRERWT